MDTPVLPRTVQSGEQRLTFNAAVLAAATTRRPGSSRWTELTVYRLPKVREEPPLGGYVVAKVGRSLVVHTAECRLAKPKKMHGWDAADDTEFRVPCLECQPTLSRLDPTTLLERDRHAVLQARTTNDLVKVLMTQGMVASSVRGMTAEIIDQLRRADPDFNQWWADEVEPNLMEDV